jgi:hypothetical protein
MIKSQYAGGILLQPVQKLVATLIFARPRKGKNANESRQRHQMSHISSVECGIFS